MNTSYADSICIAAQNAYHSDLPIDLMPLTITQDASMLAGLDSDHIGCSDWH
jgi:hypothetical protein